MGRRLPRQDFLEGVGKWEGIAIRDCERHSFIPWCHHHHNLSIIYEDEEDGTRLSAHMDLVLVNLVLVVVPCIFSVLIMSPVGVEWCYYTTRSEFA